MDEKRCTKCKESKYLDMFPPKGTKCSDCKIEEKETSKRRQRTQQQRRNHSIRASMKEADWELFTPEEIFRKDGYVCGICLKSIPKGAKYPDPLSPSLDHILAIANGGLHTKGNVQAAHLRCNLKKGAR